MYDVYECAYTYDGCVCAGAWGARRGCWTSQPGVTEGSQRPHGCWEPGLLQEQQVLLTDEPTADETRGEFLNNITYQS